MWRAWVGFNFSHSLGAVLFGALCIYAGAVVDTGGVSGWMLLLLCAIGLTYLAIGALYWFRIPIAGIAIATACLLVAWLNYIHLVVCNLTHYQKIYHHSVPPRGRATPTR